IRPRFGKDIVRPARPLFVRPFCRGNQPWFLKSRRQTFPSLFESREKPRMHVIDMLGKAFIAIGKLEFSNAFPKKHTSLGTRVKGPCNAYASIMALFWRMYLRTRQCPQVMLPMNCWVVSSKVVLCDSVSS